MQRLKIDKPCQEDWSKMTPTRQGTFCLSCEKQVHDVTRFSKKQVYELMYQSAEIPCLRTTVKLNEEIAADFDAWLLQQSFNPHGRFWLAFFLVFGLGIFGLNNTYLENEWRPFQEFAFQVLDQDTIQGLEGFESDSKLVKLPEETLSIDSNHVDTLNKTFDSKPISSKSEQKVEFRELFWIGDIVSGSVLPKESDYFIEDPKYPSIFSEMFQNSVNEFLSFQNSFYKVAQDDFDKFEIPFPQVSFYTSITTKLNFKERFYLKLINSKGELIQNLGMYIGEQGVQSQNIFFIGVPLGTYFLVMDAESFSQVEKVHING